MWFERDNISFQTVFDEVNNHIEKIYKKIYNKIKCVVLTMDAGMFFHKFVKIALVDIEEAV